MVGEVVGNGEGAGRTVLVPADGYGWHGGWHGPGPGFLLFPLIVIGLFLLFASRRGGWRGPHRYHGDYDGTTTTPARVAPPPTRAGRPTGDRRRA